MIDPTKGALAKPGIRTKSAMPTTDDDTLPPFALPGIGQNKVTAAFDGGLICSDGGVSWYRRASRSANCMA